MERAMVWVGVVALAWSTTVHPAGLLGRSRDHCRVHPSYSYREISGPFRRTGRLDVRFPTTCGSEVRAFVRRPDAFGATTQHGGVVRHRNGTSTVVTPAPTYCQLGWEIHGRHGWRQVVLRSRGGC